MGIESRKIGFPGAQGDMLAARLDLPVGKPRGYALFAHCFTCSKDIAAARRIAGGLAAEGLAVLRFDFTGLGHSEGEFANTTFASNIRDLVAAADWMRAEGMAPAILIGHSLGGAAVLSAAADIPEVKGVATIGAPADPGHVVHNFGADLEAIKRDGEAEVSLAGRSFRIRKSFIDDLEAHDLERRIADLKRDLLIFHAPLDMTVGIENAGRIFAAARHPKSFVSLDRADHLLTGVGDASYVALVIAAWASRLVPEEAVRQPAAREGEVVVAHLGEGKFPQAILAAGHSLRADEPKTVGGDNTGPSPYDLLLAGLGACTNMTLSLYAERKGWQIDRLETRLRHSKVHAEDCTACETQVGKIDKIRREITIEGPLDAEQRQKLREIADKCPVHRTLHSEVVIETEVAETVRR
ncbi:alpha/beta fold hydrolase [Nisaea sp.]|uniref:bifunctional alpha/beta hydrolase/OsmC family protein n=1 Tax=Nisaea sp. TaxID=2024842 RepID=UPI003B520BBF